MRVVLAVTILCVLFSPVMVWCIDSFFEKLNKIKDGTKIEADSQT